MSVVSSKDKNEYRNSLSSTLLFSGVQIYHIFIKIIRSKFVALFLGAEGMGITSLLHSTTDLISSFTNLGLSTSAVKTIAEAESLKDDQKIAITVTVLKRLLFVTGLIGTFVCAVSASFWSQYSFGDDTYVWSFVFVSVIILTEQLYKGELALLQGLRKKKYLAQANLIGQTVSLFLTVPLYYFYGTKAIVWVLVLFSIFTLLISKYYTRKLNIGKIHISWKNTFIYGFEMIKLGFFLSLQLILSQAYLYFVRNYVGQTGGIEEVGLYSAGTILVNIYLGLVFSAIATSYFPQLAATNSYSEMNDVVKKQAEISILLFAPLIVVFIVFIKPVILLLYNETFLPIEMMLYWAMAATLIKSFGWAMSYTILAKAKPLYFFYNEFFSMLYTFPLTLLGYKYFGLTGIGIAILVGYLLYLLQEIFVTKAMFGVNFDIGVWVLFFKLHLPLVFVFLAKSFIPNPIGIIVELMVIGATIVWVYYELNKRMDINSLIKRKIKK